MNSDQRNLAHTIEVSTCDGICAVEEAAIEWLETAIWSYANMFQLMAALITTSDRTAFNANWAAWSGAVNKYSLDFMGVAAWPMDFTALAASRSFGDVRPGTAATDKDVGAPNAFSQVETRVDSEGVVHFGNGVLDETKLGAISTNCRRVVLGPTVSVTPLARHMARRRRITLRRK